MSVYKSRHSGLVFSINASFHIRFQFFIFFSLLIHVLNLLDRGLHPAAMTEACPVVITV